MVIRFAPDKNNQKVVEEQAVWRCFFSLKHFGQF